MGVSPDVKSSISGDILEVETHITVDLCSSDGARKRVGTSFIRSKLSTDELLTFGLVGLTHPFVLCISLL